MDRIIHFTLTGVGASDQGVHEVEGRIGSWPFARPLSYHIGINCDAIDVDRVGAGDVVVYRRGKPIARSRGGFDARPLRSTGTRRGWREWLSAIAPPEQGVKRSV